MQRYVDDRRLAGVVTLLARRGRVCHFEKHGVLDLESNRPMELDTIFRIYSMTKPITSVAVMSLYEQGHFQLDDPVARFIPELGGLKVCTGMGPTEVMLVDQERPITIRHLLTHTSGLSYGMLADTPVDAMYRDSALPYDRGSNLEEMVGKLGAIPLVYQPGTGWRYSVATDVLGYLVEVLSGQPFDRFLRESIFEPLEMADTGFHVAEGKGHRLAAVYGLSDQGGIRGLAASEMMLDPFDRPAGLFAGGAGLVSTAPDYLKFCRMLLNGGELDGVRILGRKTVELMTRNHLPERLLPIAVGDEPIHGSGFGLGFAVVMDVAASGILGSEGLYRWGGAAGTRFWIDPEEDLIAILMIQFMPGSHYPIGDEFRVLTYQALVD